MTNRLPSLSAILPRGPARRAHGCAGTPARALWLALLCAALLFAAPAGPAYAQDAQAEAPAQQQAPPQAPAPPPRPAQAAAPDEPVVDESFSIRLDENLYQLEEAITLIAGSLAKVADRTPSLGINSFYFGKEVDADFRRKAEVVILDKLFQANPNVRLVQCPECQKLQTKIERGVLKLRKGVPTQEARRQLAEKLGVDGFVDIGMFTTDGQLTVYLKVVEAETGAIILVDELAGRRAPKRTALTFGFGELIFPIKVEGTDTDHKALALTVQESVKLTGRFSFAVDLVFFTDNNENNPDPHVKLDTGLLLAPTLGFDILQVPSSTSRLIFFLGIGKLIAPQLDYANLARGGLEMIVGDQLSVMFAFNSFLEAQLDSDSQVIDSGSTSTASTPPILEGAGYEIRFGYRW